MHVRRIQLFCIILVLGLCPILAQAQNYTYSLTGTLGPNLNNGPDCLKGNGTTATAAVTVSSTASPVKSTSASAIYALPAGSVTASLNIGSFTNTSTWYMVVDVTSTYDVLAFAGAGPVGSKVTAVTVLPPGTFTSGAVGSTGHPQNITKSIPLKSPSSWLEYSISAINCAATKLGFTGTIN